jgi:hypothetical protein
VAPTLGERFARALAAQDGAALRALLDDRVDFEALTPRRHWQATDAAEVNDIILSTWFGAGVRIDALESVSSGVLPDRLRISYLLRVHNGDGEHLVEQQAYYNTDGERVTWMRVLCSGFRPVPG